MKESCLHLSSWKNLENSPRPALKNLDEETRYYNVRVKEKSFLPTDLVLTKADEVAYDRQLAKLSPTWEGPYIIKELVGHGAYTLWTYAGEDVPKTWSAFDLKIFYHW